MSGFSDTIDTIAKGISGGTQVTTNKTITTDTPVAKSNTGLYVGIGVSVVVLGIAIILIVKKRKGGKT